MNTSQDLATALGISGGIVCAVGAGGKKSLLYALAREATGRVGLTATVMTLGFPRRLAARVFIDDEPALQRALARPGQAGLFAYARPSDKRGRLSGLAPGAVAAIHAGGGFDLTLVKADGARMRGIKAPKPGEPVLPASTTSVLPVVSAAVIGQPLDERVAHRPERLGELVGAAQGEALTAEHIARLLIARDGALQATEGRQVVPVINQVDDAERRALAGTAARTALERSDRFDRVALTCLRRDDPLVELVCRDGAYSA